MIKKTTERRRAGVKNKIKLNWYDYPIGIMGESGIGKEQPLSAEIVTPTGIQTMGDMKVGSQVIGQDGRSYNVVGVYPQGVKPIYRVMFNDGSIAECGLEHLWKVKNNTNNEVTVKTLESILKDYKINNNYKYSIELPRPVNFNLGHGLDIPWYLTGVTLGEIHQVDNLLNIPKALLLGEIADRYELLEGIIDSIGTLSNDIFGSKIDIKSFSISAINDIRFLAKSLGFMASISEYSDIDNNKQYTLSITGDLQNLELSFDDVDKIIIDNNNSQLDIINIEYARDEEAQCIMIDNPEHLYLTNDFIVTHNTTLAYQVCHKYLGEDGYIFFDIGREGGTDSLANVIVEKVKTWADYDYWVNDIVKYKNEDYTNLKMVVLDTWDELFDIAQKEVLRKWNVENPHDRKKSIKATYGGYMAGEDMAIELILESIDKLEAVGVKAFWIGHTKSRVKTDLLTQTEYDILSTKITNRDFEAIKTKIEVLGSAYHKREIDDKSITNVERVLIFRDNAYSVDCKSRFDSIEPQISFDPDLFVETLNKAIVAEYGKEDGNQQPIEEAREERAIKREEKIAEATATNKIDPIEVYNKIIENIKTNSTTEQKQKVKDMCDQHGVPLSELKDAPIEILLEVHSIFE